jgi:hypothetical protein
VDVGAGVTGAVVLGVLLLAPSALAAVVALGVRLRRSEGVIRRQLLVFVVAAIAVVASLLAWRVLPQPAGTLVQAAAVGLFPVAIGVAVTRHGLYDLDLAIRRASWS